jgi:alpha-1,6-mannosyltransferase
MPSSSFRKRPPHLPAPDDFALKICDLTQFYSPVSGGVKRYVSEKVRHVQERTAGDEHILIIPGERDEVVRAERARTHTIGSPLVSRTTRYRVLLRLEAIERILERERPDIIECGDPYQVGWKAVRSGAALGIPVVAFYHSHFPEAYLRSVQKFCGATVAEFCVELARRYVRSLYNRFERTLVPSPALGALLGDWGVRHVVHCDLGVDTAIFRPQPESGEDVRAQLVIPREPMLLLYVGRLAQEKNTATLFAAFRQLAHAQPGRFHLLVVGDGTQRALLRSAMGALPSAITHLAYCADARRLAQLYRAADLFVHPGVQETFGLVALEAQACGTPVVGIRGSYMDRIIQGDQRHWAPVNTPEALAAAIQGAGAARRRVATGRGRPFSSWTQVFDRMFDLYRTVIRDYRRR